MQKELSKKRMDQMMAEVMHKKVADLRALLTKNGIENAASMGDNDVRRAFLKAVKDSSSFRSDLAGYFASLVQEKATFVRQSNMQDFVDQPQLGFTAPVDDLDPTSTTQVSTSSVSSGSTSTKGSFWNTLGGLASKDNLQSLFNTGLSAASTSLQAKANKDSEERALELERLRLQQIQAQSTLAANGGLAKTGLSTGAIIGIVGGSLLLITTIVLLTRKKK